MSIQTALDDLKAHGEAMLKQFRSAVAVDEQNLLDFLDKIEEVGRHVLPSTDATQPDTQPDTQVEQASEQQAAI